MNNFLSNAGLTPTITLLFFVVILAPAMLLGFSFARRKKFRPHHKYMMTAITIAVWVFILAVMIGSYRAFVLPAEFGGPLANNPRNILPTIHLITGGIAQILATYLVIYMWTEKTSLSWIVPPFLRTNNIKPIMRTTLALWLVTIALGVGIFLTWYAPGGATAAPPVATEEVQLLETEAPETEPVETEEADDSDNSGPGSENSGMGSSGDDEPVETEEAED